MQLLEIVLQGVGSLPATLKTSFKAGYNVILGANQSGKTTVFEALLAILLGKNPEMELPTRGIAQTQPSRGGITIKEGNTVYRIMKDFRSGTILLSQLNPSTSKFDPILKGWEAVEDFLKRSLAFPSMPAFESLFTLSSRTLPSAQKPSSPSLPSPAPEASSQPSALTLADHGSFLGDEDEEKAQEDTPQTLEAKLSQLRSELSHAEEIDRIEFEHGGIQSRIFELDKKISELDEADKEVLKVEDERKKYKFFADLPDGIEARIASYRKVNEQRAKEVGQLEFEIDDLQRHAKAVVSGPFFKEKNFIAGAGIAVGCLIASRVAAAFFPWGNYILLGSFIGVILMFYVAWQDFEKKDIGNKLQEKIQAKKEKISQVEKRFEIEGGVVKNLLRMTRLDAPEDLKLELENYRSLGIEEKYKAAQEKKQALLSQGDRATYVKERDELRAKAGALVDRLRNLGAAAKDVNEIKKEIRQLEKKLKEMRGTVTPTPVAVPKPVPTGGGPLGDIFSKARGVLLTDFPSFRASVRDRFMSYFSTLTTQAYTLDDFNESGGVFLFSSALGRRITFEELSPSLQDIVFVAFILSILEIISERWKGPVLLDDPFVNFEEGILMGVGQSLKKLSGLTQIIHLSSRGGFATQADNTVSLR